MTDIERALQFLRANGFTPAADSIAADLKDINSTLLDAMERAERYRASLRKIGRKYRETLGELREWRDAYGHCVYCGSQSPVADDGTCPECGGEER